MVDDSVSVIQINAGHSFATRCTKTIMSYYYVYFHFSWENAKGWERRWPKVQAGVPDSLSLPGGGDPLDWDPQFFPPLQPIQYIAARSAGPKIKFFGGGRWWCFADRWWTVLLGTNLGEGERKREQSIDRLTPGGLSSLIVAVLLYDWGVPSTRIFWPALAGSSRQTLRQPLYVANSQLSGKAGLVRGRRRPSLLIPSARCTSGHRNVEGNWPALLGAICTSDPAPLPYPSWLSRQFHLSGFISLCVARPGGHRELCETIDLSPQVTANPSFGYDPRRRADKLSVDPRLGRTNQRRLSST